MRRAQGRARQAEDDLREHERTTQDLIQRVNMLDAVVADARRTEAARSEPAEQARTSAAPTPPAQSEAAKTGTPMPDLSGVLREAREKIASLADTAAAQLEMREQGQQTNQGEAEPPVDNSAVIDDLESRRQRLSKR